MRSQEMRLRCKRSHMPCHLVNFIFGEPGIRGLVGMAVRDGEGEGRRRDRKKKKGKVGKTPPAKEKKCGGERISYHHHGFDDIQRCPVGSVSVQAWSPGESRAQQPGGEQESKRPARRRARERRGPRAALL